MVDKAESASLPRQASLRRLREHGITPNRELGQNFLIDDNVLGVIEREAQLDPADVVLEIGGGLGVLSEFLAPRVAHLHVMEIDPALAPALLDALAPHANASLHIGDAVELDHAALTPAPTKVVANLPYGVAATVVLDTIAHLPQVELWLVMVQLEVARRLAAEPGSKAYGATSVLAQTACEVRVARRISRSVFHPEPNVDSALALLRRRAPAASPELSGLVHAAFAHRRKTLAGSLALAAAAPDGVRERARAGLAAIGQPEDARAERLSAADFAALGQELGPDDLAALAGAR